MNDLIAEIEKRSLITPQSSDYYGSYPLSDDDLREIEYNRLMAADPSIFEQQLLAKQHQKERERDLQQTLEHEPINLDEWFSEYNTQNNLTPYGF